MILNDSLINKRIDELKLQYTKAKKQLNGLERTIESLENYANYIIKNNDFKRKPIEMSDEAWRKRASEMINELMKIDKSYSTFNSVLTPIYRKLRDVYGVVIDQLRKEYSDDYDTLRRPTAFEAISANKTVRDIFDSLLIDMFPSNYFVDEALEASKTENANDAINKKESSDEIIMRELIPLAAKRGDNSYWFYNTFNEVFLNMDCSWHNLQLRYMKKHNLKKAPPPSDIIVNNDNVFRKFKKVVKEMLKEYNDQGGG